MTTQKFSTKTPRLVLGFLLGGAIFLSAGCSENNGKPAGSEENVANVTQSATKAKEQHVAQRAKEHMDALIARNWEKAYGYLPPATRKLKPLQVYANKMKSGAIIRTAATVKGVHCEEDVCNVSIDLSYIYSGVVDALRGQESNSRLKEKWIFSQGEWWLAPE